MASNGILVLYVDGLVLGRYAGRHMKVWYLQLNLKWFNSLTPQKMCGYRERGSKCGNMLRTGKPRWKFLGFCYSCHFSVEFDNFQNKKVEEAIYIYSNWQPAALLWCEQLRDLNVWLPSNPILGTSGHWRMLVSCVKSSPAPLWGEGKRAGCLFILWGWKDSLESTGKYRGKTTVSRYNPHTHTWVSNLPY